MNQHESTDETPAGGTDNHPANASSDGIGPAHFRDLLEVFDNPAPQCDFNIEHYCPEFTSVCPKTGQPDFGTIVFTYVPDRVCVELKSLKMYLQCFRDEGIYYEAVTNRILDDFVAVVQPRRLKVESKWTPRGGLNSNIIIEYPQ